ncbi:MAG: phospholipase D-like domain-containing protein [Anaerolineae bacterium]
MLIVLAVIAQFTGFDPLGLFEVPEPTAISQPVPENREDLASPLAVYFTAPTGESDRSTYVGGVDETLAAAIRGARQTVDIAAFELNSQPIADALLDRHRQGVRVRIVTDDDHGLDVSLYEQYLAASEDEKEDILLEFEEDPADTLLDELYDAGIPIVDDDRSALMHNKFVILDGAEVWTGSLNLTVNGSYRNNNNIVRVQSRRVAEDYQTEFNEMFEARQFGPTSPANTPYPQVVVNGVPIEVYFAPEDGVIDRIIEEINAAQSSMKFMAFSFTENALGEAVLNRVAQGGFSVQGVVETTGSMTQWSEMPKFHCAGLDVRQDGNKYILHHKVIILDDSTVILGSFNFSGSATESNDENLLIIHDAGIAAQFLAEYEQRFAEGSPPEGIDCSQIQ